VKQIRAYRPLAALRHGSERSSMIGGIPKLALHCHDDAMDVTVAELDAPLQCFGNRYQERIAIAGGERCSGGEDRHHLRISQGNRRRHAADPAAGFRHTLERDRSQCDAAAILRAHRVGENRTARGSDRSRPKTRRLPLVGSRETGNTLYGLP
jgi:hypothetical protein